MRAFDRDLIRGGHYGQRPCAPRLTGRTHGCTDQQCDVKISLANSEPSTHGTKRTFGDVSRLSALGGKADTNSKTLSRQPRWAAGAPGTLLSIAARVACSVATTCAPSPTAAATRLIEPERTSPMAKMPRRLVSSGLRLSL